MNQIVILSLLTTALSLTLKGHASYYDYNLTQNEEVYQQFGHWVLIIIVIIVCIPLLTVACYFCCRAYNRRSQPSPNSFSEANYHFQKGRFAEQSQNNSFYPPPNYFDQHPSFQPPQQQHQLNPYIVENISQINNKICNKCFLKNREGQQQPRIRVRCSSNHIFHLGCIASSLHSGRLACPKCMEICPPSLLMFCSSCKERNTIINLQYYENSGGLNIDALKAKYGELCPICVKR